MESMRPQNRNKNQRVDTKITWLSVFIQPYLEHEAINLDVNVLIRFLWVAELVDLHELLQALPEVEGEKVEPHQAARIQNQLQSVQLGVQVRTRD